MISETFEWVEVDGVFFFDPKFRGESHFSLMEHFGLSYDCPKAIHGECDPRRPSTTVRGSIYCGNNNWARIPYILPFEIKDYLKKAGYYD